MSPKIPPNRFPHSTVKGVLCLWGTVGGILGGNRVKKVLSIASIDYRAVASDSVSLSVSLARQSGRRAIATRRTLGLRGGERWACMQNENRCSRKDAGKQTSKPKTGAGRNTGQQKKKRRVGTAFVVSPFSSFLFFVSLACLRIVPRFLAGFVCLGLPCACVYISH